MSLIGPQTLGIDEVLGFGYGEHLLVWAWRRLAIGRGDCPLLVREFDAACGEDGPEVLATLAFFLQVLARASRRRLAIGPPCCLALTADERQVLTLLAAAQTDHSAVFEAHLRWLATRDARPALAIGARALATAFGVHELQLPLPPLPAPERCTRIRAPILAAAAR